MTEASRSLFADYSPSVLSTPTWYGGPNDELPLPLPVSDYKVSNQGDRSTVRVITTGEQIYSGIGPAQVRPSRPPA